ncbi:response regulator [Caldinitratiruptor microaerophilus]|uniref:Stage 0 sporulation protein A homolog n=1 Tax=Caldinitratiruptor microaerophilus TaxID=671077 RepID=A0AA35CMZ7_9FIRM|nr:response regulator transcription factor [Caldinitratiruptor microaerophilus]BDG62294.1 DNA-binding response regulator [Caldinitratiruptor microaerophilus]
MQTVRTLIVDDSPLSRRGIAAVLGEDPSFEVVGEAADGMEAVEKAQVLMPDLVLMDIRMPRMDGLEATKRIKAVLPYVTIVILSVSEDVQDFFEAIKYGAQGYLLKDMHPEQWLEYLRAVMNGDVRVSRSVASHILREFAQSAAEGEAAGELTAREREVLEAVASGLSNREIGQRLHIAETTVKNHLRNILTKLHLRNRTELVAYAYQHGWLRRTPGGTAGRSPGG